MRFNIVIRLIKMSVYVLFITKEKERICILKIKV